MKICITFDVDNESYLESRSIDELDLYFQSMREIISSYKDIKTTWFLRIDRQAESIGGRPDYVFITHRDKIKWLLDNGHEVGWHHHAYIKQNDKWVQDLNEDRICHDLKSYGEIALSYGVKSLRAGWGFHTNATIKTTNDLGIKIDSSAIPRPRYSWEKSSKDWNNTPAHPYFPSKKDYRLPGKPEVGILEIPISVTRIEAPYDTDKGILRYINLAYHREIFKKAMESVMKDNEYIVIIAHPYEFFDGHKNPLLSFDISSLKSNLDFLCELENGQFLDISSISIPFRGK